MMSENNNQKIPTNREKYYFYGIIDSELIRVVLMITYQRREDLNDG